MMNLCCGFYAMMMHKMAINTMDSWALAALLIAFGCDFLDGYLARRGNLTSAFGERLDSLADLISFGTAPMFFALSMSKEWEVGLLVACGLYLVCGAARLARYDPVSQGKVFKGMPIPIAGLSLAAFSLVISESHVWKHSGNIHWFALAPVILGLLMISDIPFLKVSFVGPKKGLPLTLAAISLAVLAVTHSLPLATLGFTVPYTILNFVLAAAGPLVGRMRALREARSAVD